MDRNRINTRHGFCSWCFSWPHTHTHIHIHTSSGSQTVPSRIGDNTRCTFEIFASRYCSSTFAATLLDHSRKRVSDDRAESVFVDRARTTTIVFPSLSISPRAWFIVILLLLRLLLLPPLPLLAVHTFYYHSHSVDDPAAGFANGFLCDITKRGISARYSLSLSLSLFLSTLHLSHWIEVSWKLQLRLSSSFFRSNASLFGWKTNFLNPSRDSSFSYSARIQDSCDLRFAHVSLNDSRSYISFLESRVYSMHYKYWWH